MATRHLHPVSECYLGDSMKREEAQETQVELMTAGLVVVIFAIYMLNIMSGTVAMVVSGLVLLGSGLYQSRKGWHVSITTWLLGLILLLGGLGLRVFLVALLEINWVAIGLALVGGYIIWQTLKGR